MNIYNFYYNKILRKLNKYILFLLFIGMGLPLLSQKLPQPMYPPCLVNDFTNFLTPNERNQLEFKLKNYYDTTSTQMYVVTVSDLNGYSIDNYAIQLGNDWGIGQKGKNNGLLILIKPKIGNQRGEIFIAVGYGLEGAIPDAYSKRVIYQYIEPAFKEGLYYKGLDDAITVLMQMASGEFKADDSSDFGLILIAIIIVSIFVLAALFSKHSKGGGGSFTGGSIFGGFGSGGSRGGSSRGGGFSGGGGGSFGGGGARGGW